MDCSYFFLMARYGVWGKWTFYRTGLTWKECLYLFFPLNLFKRIFIILICMNENETKI